MNISQLQENDIGALSPFEFAENILKKSISRNVNLENLCKML